MATLSEFLSRVRSTLGSFESLMRDPNNWTQGLTLYVPRFRDLLREAGQISNSPLSIAQTRDLNDARIILEDLEDAPVGHMPSHLDRLRQYLRITGTGAAALVTASSPAKKYLILAGGALVGLFLVGAAFRALRS